MFYVGQKVQAIKDDHPNAPFPHIQRGQVVTIAEIFPSEEDGDDMLQFVELRFDGDHDLEPGWHAGSFRPVVERKTDISIFTKILAPAEKVPA